MTSQFPPFPPQQQPEPEQPKRKRSVVKMLAIGIGVVLLLIIVVSVASGGGSSNTSSSAPVTSQPPVTYALPAPASPVAPAAPATSEKPAGPATSASDGLYEVGVDLAAGRYKTAGPDASSFMPNCYYARLKNDSGEFDAIIANGNLQGPGSVTVKAGEFVQFTGGCEWSKA